MATARTSSARTTSGATTSPGDLQGVPLKRGVRQDGAWQGGMPADFKNSEHGLTKLRVARRGGVVFATFDAEVEPFEDFLGPEMLRWYDRLFNGRKLTLLGRSRQRIPGNWKLMQENIKDPYHPGLLHTWFVTFGLWRADNKSQLRMDAKHRHAAMISERGAAKSANAEVTSGVTSFKAAMELNDDRFLDVVPEAWWGGPTAVMMTLFPSVIFQQQVNSVSTRHIQPRGPGEFDFVWTHFGFEDDTPEMTQRRLRQANLFGPVGFVSADDGEVIEFSQNNFDVNDARSTLAELGGREVGDWERWPAFFTSDCRYRVQPRENFDQGLPLCTMAFESQGMLRDRVYGISNTLVPRAVLPAPCDLSNMSSAGPLPSCSLPLGGRRAAPWGPHDLARRCRARRSLRRRVDRRHAAVTSRCTASMACPSPPITSARMAPAACAKVSRRPRDRMPAAPGAPATQAIRVYATKIESGRVWIDAPA
jgi:phenylpropionate dioxygenase-like ring-hydroxylating dioxygenase large terminal subunit